MFHYKNTSENTLMLPMIGEVKPGAKIQSDTEIENPNLQPLVKNERMVGVDPVTKPKGK